MNVLVICALICLPLKSLWPTSAFGYRNHPLSGKYQLHNGVDLRASHDTVFAVMAGRTAAVSYASGIGLHIRLDHDSVATVYGHLSQAFLVAGEPVEAGQPIGITGATGRVTAEHLHFSVFRAGHCINPLEFIYQNIINNKKHE